MNHTIKHDIALFDFLRGWAALFVFFHHAAILGGGPYLLQGVLGHEAVNAFMLASGFLIFYQASISKSYQGLKTKAGIKNFYIRRFFRIAPAYYVVFIIALLSSVYIGMAREIISDIFPNTATNMDRYFIEDYITSFFMHITFFFGLIPQYAFSTPLPDWSLGLEMQFYLIFPLLFVFYKKNFSIALTGTLIIMMALSVLSFKAGLHFPMPSFLPLKFHNFAAGITLAYLYINTQETPFSFNPSNIFIICITLLFLTIGNETLLIPVGFIAIWWFLILDDKKTKRLKSLINIIFKHKSSKFLADISYSLYIIHLLVMIPYFSLVLSGSEMPELIWLGHSLIILCIVMLLSLFSYRFIELPGIDIGKRLITRSSS